MQPDGPRGLNAALVDRMIEIVSDYSVDIEEAREIVYSHLQHADYLNIAYVDDRIIGLLATSKERRQTPFAASPLPVVYQRMLFLDPAFLAQGIGMRLFVKSMYDQFGFFWLFNRFVLVCRTQSARVASKMNQFSQIYPRIGEKVPEAVREFAGTLLTMLGAKALDENFCLKGTFERLAGEDYTAFWQQYLRSPDEAYNRLMLTTTFSVERERVINTGALLMMIGYARPLALSGLLCCYLCPVNVKLVRVALAA